MLFVLETEQARWLSYNSFPRPYLFVSFGCSYRGNT